MMTGEPERRPSRWPRRLAWSLVFFGLFAIFVNLSEELEREQGHRALLEQQLVGHKRLMDSVLALQHENRIFVREQAAEGAVSLERVESTARRLERLVIGLARRGGIPDAEISAMLSSIPPLDDPQPAPPEDAP